VLGILENMTSIDPSWADRLATETPLVSWLVHRISITSSSKTDSNRQYASELLAVLCQTSKSARLKCLQDGNQSDNMNEKMKSDGMESLLKILSVYRKKDPETGEEVEIMENVFDVVCSLLSDVDGKLKFGDAEGVELLTLMLK
jgi:beta-catenin-like protein 1